MEATYVGISSFKIVGDETSEFLVNRRVRLDCAEDGIKYANIESSVYSDTYTTVVVNEPVITVNLITAFYGVVKPGIDGNLPSHYHTEGEGDGGYIPEVIPYFKELLDTPSTYSGTENFYAKSTGSGIVFEELQIEKSFLDLNDTPSTYSGTENFYAKSTGSGIVFEELQIEKSFLDLNDTPSTYSGTYGQFAVSTGSGIAFEDTQVKVGAGAPLYENLDVIGSIYIDSSVHSIFEKNRFPTSSINSISAKSVVIDIADNWGSTYNTALRSVDFYLNETKIDNIETVDFVAYNTTMLSSNYSAGLVFNTSLIKTGSAAFHGWMSSSSHSTNQRLVCVFNEITDFNCIKINNTHDSGNWAVLGAKNVKITVSSDEIVSTIYDSPISNSTLIYNSIFYEHVSLDIEDEYSLTLINLPGFIDTGWDTVLSTKNNLIELNDTPVTYSGTENFYAKSTGSGIIFEPAEQYNFIDLLDTPSTYSGIEDRYLRTTQSGIYAVEGIIITSSNNTDWVIRVTDQGTLYTEELY